MKIKKLALVSKRMSLLIFFCLIASLSFAGPFGLSMGMKKEEIDSSLEEVAAFVYAVEKVKKPHRAFGRYEVWIGPDTGICRIRAFSKLIPTNRDGQDLKEAFQSLEKRLKKLYGDHERMDELQADSIWRKPNDWMMALVFKERVFSSEWNIAKGAILTPDLAKVELIATAEEEYSGQVLLQYTFENFEQCQSEFNKAEEDAL